MYLVHDNIEYKNYLKCNKTFLSGQNNSKGTERRG
jgi:hypothetical protein